MVEEIRPKDRVLWRRIYIYISQFFFGFYNYNIMKQNYFREKKTWLEYT